MPQKNFRNELVTVNLKVLTDVIGPVTTRDVFAYLRKVFGQKIEEVCSKHISTLGSEAVHGYLLSSPRRSIASTISITPSTTPSKMSMGNMRVSMTCAEEAYYYSLSSSLPSRRVKHHSLLPWLQASPAPSFPDIAMI